MSMETRTQPVIQQGFFYYILVSNSYDKIKQKYPSFNVYKTLAYVYIFVPKIYWIQPSIYYNRLNYHLEVADAAGVSQMEDAFAEEIKKRGEDFKFYQDQYGEHPDDRVVKNDEVSQKLADVATLTNIFGGLKEKVL